MVLRCRARSQSCFPIPGALSVGRSLSGASIARRQGRFGGEGVGAAAARIEEVNRLEIFQSWNYSSFVGSLGIRIVANQVDHRET